MRILAAIMAWVLLMNVSAHAQQFGIDSVRAGFWAHSIDEAGPGGAPINLANWEDVSFEVLFTSPDIDAFRWIGSPRPNIGATVNLNGRESMVHLGLTWQVQIFDSPFFVEGTLGAALHNGALNGAAAPLRNHGCHFAFYEAAALGYQINENVDVMLAWEHASNAKLCSPNQGLTQVGFKLGYNF